MGAEVGKMTPSFAFVAIPLIVNFDKVLAETIMLGN